MRIEGDNVYEFTPRHTDAVATSGQSAAGTQVPQLKPHDRRPSNGAGHAGPTHPAWMALAWLGIIVGNLIALIFAVRFFWWGVRQFIEFTAKVMM